MHNLQFVYIKINIVICIYKVANAKNYRFTDEYVLQNLYQIVTAAREFKSLNPFIEELGEPNTSIIICVCGN